MSLAWYEKMGGAGRSGQIVSSEKLLSELKRLECRFRQRGSHITFHHDETGTRGTVVYGTRKLWSQKTVADALARINAQTRGNLAPAGDDVPEKELSQNFYAVAAPSIIIPPQFVTQTSPDYPSQIIVRHRDFPQIGSVITPYDLRENVQQTLKDIERRKNNFERTLNLMKEEDFQVVNNGDVILLRHPIHQIQALLGPYDPSETQEPQAILERCYDDLVPFADNQSILEEVIKSRKLELMSEKCDDNGVYHRTYISRRFQRGYGARIELEASENGHVSDRALVGFLDDVDRQFFDCIEQILKHHYGYEIVSEKFGSRVEASHPMLKEVNFTFPKFENLLTLRDIHARREALGEKWYIESVNRILDQRDDILELVSYGLIFSIEQMTAASNTFFDVIEATDKCAKMLEKIVANPEQYESSEPLDPVVREEAQANAKRLSKKFRKIEKMSGNGSGGNMDHDVRDVKDQHQAYSMRGQKLPETFPCGKVMSMPVKTVSTQPPVMHRYMVVKGPEGEPIIVFSEEGMGVLRKNLFDAMAKLPPDLVPAESNIPALLVGMRQEAVESLRQRMPEIQ